MKQVAHCLPLAPLGGSFDVVLFHVSLNGFAESLVAGFGVTCKDDGELTLLLGGLGEGLKDLPVQRVVVGQNKGGTRGR